MKLISNTKIELFKILIENKLIFIDIKKVIEINIKYLKIFLRVKAQLIFIVLKVTDKIKRKFKASAMHIPNSGTYKIKYLTNIYSSNNNYQI